MYTKEQLNQVFVGSCMSYYDSWNDTQKYFKILSVKKVDASYVFAGKEERQKVRVPARAIDSLYHVGKFTQPSKIEGCYVEERFKIC